MSLSSKKHRQFEVKTLREYVFRGTITQEDRRRADYKYVCFNVPEQADVIHVAYDYPKTPAKKNVVDIGVFDSEGSFRGWSGSNRTSFFVSNFTATPGYLLGKICPGMWKIILGLYAISPDGCEYAVKIWVGGIRGTLQEREVVYSSGIEKPKKSGWFKGDLHAHTCHSDGVKSIDELVRESEKMGLDFLALTDHNTVSQSLDIAKPRLSDVLLIPGEEVTTYYGHANVWGNGEWVDFRRRTRKDFKKLIDEVHAKGLLISVNHPKSVDFFDGYWKFWDIVGFDCMEVWQGPWSSYNHRSLAWWDELLMKGERVVAVGGSDFHGAERGLANPTTWIYSDSLSVGDILDAIRRGHVFISRYVNGPEIHFCADVNGDGEPDCMCGDEIPLSGKAELAFYMRAKGAEGLKLRLISDGRVLEAQKVSGIDHISAYRARVEDDAYFRADIVKPPESECNDTIETEVLALANPIYIRAGDRSARKTTRAAPLRQSHRGSLSS